jgi:ATP-dependent exoDNAse (exonuclease V) beta subunit
LEADTVVIDSTVRLLQAPRVDVHGDAAQNATKRDDDEAENVFYVAVTRAKALVLFVDTT